MVRIGRIGSDWTRLYSQLVVGCSVGGASKCRPEAHTEHYAIYTLPKLAYARQILSGGTDKCADGLQLLRTSRQFYAKKEQL